MDGSKNIIEDGSDISFQAGWDLGGRLKVAICHDYLNQMGGAERVLKVFLDMFPDAKKEPLEINSSKLYILDSRNLGAEEPEDPKDWAKALEYMRSG